MRIDFSPSRRTSLGVEWELELVDLGSRQLIGASDAILAAISPDGEHAKAKHDVGLLCSGTHPITDWATQQVTDLPRYLALMERNQWMARQLLAEMRDGLAL